MWEGGCAPSQVEHKENFAGIYMCMETTLYKKLRTIMKCLPLFDIQARIALLVG